MQALEEKFRESEEIGKDGLEGLFHFVQFPTGGNRIAFFTTGSSWHIIDKNLLHRNFNI